MKTLIAILIIAGSLAAFADWKISTNVGGGGRGRATIFHNDDTLVATLDAIVDVEDYPKKWFAERIVDAHNGELRIERDRANIDNLAAVAQIGFAKAAEIVVMRSGHKLTKEQAEQARAEMAFAVRHLEAAIDQASK